MSQRFRKGTIFFIAVILFFALFPATVFADNENNVNNTVAVAPKESVATETELPKETSVQWNQLALSDSAQSNGNQIDSLMKKVDALRSIPWWGFVVMGAILVAIALLVLQWLNLQGMSKTMKEGNEKILSKLAVMEIKIVNMEQRVLELENSSIDMKREVKSIIDEVRNLRDIVEKILLSQSNYHKELEQTHQQTEIQKSYYYEESRHTNNLSKQDYNVAIANRVAQTATNRAQLKQGEWYTTYGNENAKGARVIIGDDYPYRVEFGIESSVAELFALSLPSDSEVCYLIPTKKNILNNANVHRLFRISGNTSGTFEMTQPLIAIKESDGAFSIPDTAHLGQIVFR